MQKLNFQYLLLILSLLCASNSIAQTHYISDELFVPMRSGPGNEFRIIHSRLKSGLAMTVIDMPAEGDWAQVRTPKGLEGWIRKQYLSKKPTAKIVLKNTSESLAKSQQEAAKLKTSLEDITAKYESLMSTSNSLKQTHNSLTQEHTKLKTLSQDAVNLNKRYRELLEKHELLLTDFDAVRAENDRLSRSNTINQWLAGAGLLILGMLITVIGPALKPKSRNSDWVN